MDGASCCSDRVELILERVESLPTLGPVAARLLTITSAEDYDIDEVCALIETDPSLTARVLALCREAGSRLADRVTTVKRALVALGIQRVRSAVLSVSVYELMDRVGHESDLRLAGASVGVSGRFDREGFWTHSIGVACAGELIASSQPEIGVRPDDAFVAGLLHGLGRLALDVVLPRAHERVLGLAERRRCASAVIEREVFGVDHHLVGKRLGEHWGLPDHLVDVMWLHSQPREALPVVEHRALISMVSVARSMVRELHVGWSGDFDRARSWTDAGEDAGLDASALEAKLGEVHDRTASRCRVLGLGEPTSPELLLRSIVEANRSLGRMNDLLVSRQREAEAMRARLRHLEAFSGRVGAGMPASGVMDEVVRAAGELLGADRCAGVLECGDRWQWHRCVGAGAGDGSVEVGLPEAVDPGPDGSGDAFDRQRPGGLGDPVASVLPWAASRLGSGASRWRVVRLSDPGVEREGRAALLVACDRPEASRELIEGAAGLWAMALGSAMQHDRVRRYGEMLGSANRALVEAQRAMAERESMARLGELAAGAAHEMNTPLAVISGRAQVLRGRVDDEVCAAAAEAIAEAAGDVSELVSDLHLLARPLEGGTSPLTVEQLLRDALVRAGERTGGADRVEVTCDSGLGLRGDGGALCRALEEVLVNALECSKREIVRVRAETDAVDGRLWVVVEDSGPGLSERALAHAFDPFFSEKPAGRGRGLGLARARRIVEAHGGRIVLENGPRGGARVMIELAASSAPRAAA